LMMPVFTYKNVVALPERVLEDSLRAAGCHTPRKTNYYMCIQKKRTDIFFIQPWHLLQDDLTVLAGSLAGAGAIVVPLGQLTGIGRRAGEGLHQPDQ
jgi:hypothetical protein